MIQFLYPVVCLVLGTVPGAASWWREALLHLLVLGALVYAYRAARTEGRLPRAGGLFEPALAALFIVLAAGALGSACGALSWRLVVLSAAAVAVFYLVLGAESGRWHWTLPATATAAAALGLAVYALGWTARVAFPLGHHNYMAGFLLLHLPLAASAAMRTGSALGWFWAAAAAIQVAAIVLSGSLAAMIVLTGLGMLALFSAGFSRRKFALLLALVTLGALAFRLAPGTIFGGLRQRAAGIVAERRDPTLSLENRLRYLRTGLAMAADRPLAGVGLGATPLAAALYREQVPGLTPPGEALRQLHNLPVNLLAETGFLGFAAALLLALAIWERGHPARNPEAMGIWAYLAFSLNDYQLDLPAILLPLAILGALSVRQNSAPRVPHSALVRVALAGATLVGAFLFARTAIAHFYFARNDSARAALWEPHCGFYHFQAGARADHDGRAEAARESYLLAARTLANVVPVAAQTGSSLARAGQYTNSLPWLERAAALDYYFTLAHFHLGQARLRTGDRAGAIESFSTALLTQPATLMAEAWLFPPERDVYVESLERAIDRLYELAAFNPESGPWRRWNELGAYLVGRRNLLPEGPRRVLLYEVVDRDLAANHSLLVFRRLAPPVRVTPVVLLVPTVFRPPAGLGLIEGIRTKGFWRSGSPFPGPGR